MADRISSAEHEVMEVLWREPADRGGSRASACRPRSGWSDRTVKTLLARLLAKGVLAHEEDGRRYLYRPAVARDDYVAQESRRLLDRLFGGRVTPLVAHLAQRDRLTRARHCRDRGAAEGAQAMTAWFAGNLVWASVGDAAGPGDPPAGGAPVRGRPGLCAVAGAGGAAGAAAAAVARRASRNCRRSAR